MAAELIPFPAVGRRGDVIEIAALAFRYAPLSGETVLRQRRDAYARALRKQGFARDVSEAEARKFEQECRRVMADMHQMLADRAADKRGRGGGDAA